MKYNNHIKHYKLDAEYYNFFETNEFMEQEHQRRFQTIFNLVKINNKENILNVGASAGYAVQHIKTANYFPFDISIHNFAKIRENSSRSVLPVSGGVYNLPYGSDSFDIIILSEVLEHLEFPQKALREICRVLKPSGFFIVSVPYKEKISYQICIHCNQPTPTNAHLHSFDKDKLIKLTSENGFVTVKSIKCINKISNRLRVNIILKTLPYQLWKLIDIFFNFLFDKPTSIMLLCKKCK